MSPTVRRSSYHISCFLLEIFDWGQEILQNSYPSTQFRKQHQKLPMLSVFKVVSHTQHSHTGPVTSTQGDPRTLTQDPTHFQITQRTRSQAPKGRHTTRSPTHHRLKEATATNTQGSTQTSHTPRLTALSSVSFTRAHSTTSQRLDWQDFGVTTHGQAHSYSLRSHTQSCHQSFCPLPTHTYTLSGLFQGLISHTHTVVSFIDTWTPHSHTLGSHTHRDTHILVSRTHTGLTLTHNLTCRTHGARLPR